MLQVFTIRAVRLEPAAVLPVSLQSSKHAAETSSAGCDTPVGEASRRDQGR
jgi:hypothetical protein